MSLRTELQLNLPQAIAVRVHEPVPSLWLGSTHLRSAADGHGFVVVKIAGGAVVV